MDLKEIKKKIKKKEITGISEKFIDKLIECGLRSTEEVISKDKYKLSKLTEITETTATKIINRFKAIYKPEMKTAFEIKQIRDKLGHISTGCKDLNSVLGGGVEMQAMTEFAGQFGSGKSQTMFTLSVMAQLPEEEGGVNGSVFFIDTEATFRPTRILQISVNRGIDKKECLEKGKSNLSKTLKNIYVISSPTSHLLLINVEALPNIIKEFNMKNKDKPVKLVIVDSLMAPFRSDYIGRGELAPRQQNLGRCLQNLQRVAMENDLAVVFTNQVISTPDSFFKRDVPAGGHRMGHAAQYRIFLRKGSQGKRVFKIIDAPNIEETEVIVRLTDKGIE